MGLIDLSGGEAGSYTNRSLACALHFSAAEQEGKAMVRVFQHDPVAFRAWRDEHPYGYILNVPRGSTRAVLHRGECATLTQTRLSAAARMRSPRICAHDRQAIEQWAAEHGYDLALCTNCDV
jgi:hypothetical protein